jgi:hypothetical protein
MPMLDNSGHMIDTGQTKAYEKMEKTHTVFFANKLLNE